MRFVPSRRSQREVDHVDRKREERRGSGDEVMDEEGGEGDEGFG